MVEQLNSIEQWRNKCDNQSKVTTTTVRVAISNSRPFRTHIELHNFELSTELRNDFPYCHFNVRDLCTKVTINFVQMSAAFIRIVCDGGAGEGGGAFFAVVRMQTLDSVFLSLALFSRFFLSNPKCCRTISKNVRCVECINRIQLKNSIPSGHFVLHVIFIYSNCMS